MTTTTYRLTRVMRPARRVSSTRARRRWLAAWLGGVIVGVVNGAGRELIYKDRVGELTAHQISGAVAVTLFAGYFAVLQKRWPLPSTRTALSVGASWVVMTALFDFLFGHYVDGKSWSTLANDYNVTQGRLWIFVLLWLGVGPAVVRKAMTTKSRRSPGGAGFAGVGSLRG